MRVLHASSSYPLTSDDSSAPFMAEMLESYARRGHEVFVLVPRMKGLLEGERGGVQVIGVPYAPGPLQVWGQGRSLDAGGSYRPSALAITPIALAAFALAIRHHTARLEPDVAHLHWLVPLGVLASVVPRGVKVVISVHGADIARSRGALASSAKRALSRADAVIGASPAALDKVAALGAAEPPPMHVVRHGANDFLFTSGVREQARRELGVSSDARLVVGVGRLVDTKGFDALVGASALIPDDRFETVIIGEGPLRDELERSIDSAGGRVRLTGPLPRRDVARWLAACDVVVVPSTPTERDADTGPVVLMEALASGTPVVATPVGMAPELITNGENGWIVARPDPALIASAVVDVVAETERLGQNARRTFDSIGGWSRHAEEVESVYASVLGPH